MTRAPVRERWLLALAVAVHLAVLYWPRAPSGPDLVALDKVVHVAVFAAVAVAARRCGWPAVPVAVVLLLHAVVSEVLQDAVLAGRSGDVLDVVADVVGVGVGLALASRYGSHGERRREKVERA